MQPAKGALVALLLLIDLACGQALPGTVVVESDPVESERTPASTVILVQDSLKDVSVAAYDASSDLTYSASVPASAELLGFNLGVVGTFDKYFGTTLEVAGNFGSSDILVSVTDGTNTWTVLRSTTQVTFTATSAEVHPIDSSTTDSEGGSEFTVHVGYVSGTGLVVRYGTYGGVSATSVFPSVVPSGHGSALAVTLHRGTSVDALTFRSIKVSTIIDAYDTMGIAMASGTLGPSPSLGNLGFDFKVAKEIEIERLGVLDSAMRQFEDGSVYVSVYDTNTGEELVGPVEFSAKNPGYLVGAARFKSLPLTVRVPVNAVCTVAVFGHVVNVNQLVAVASTFNTNGDAIVFDGARYNKATAPSFPGTAVDPASPVNALSFATFGFRKVDVPLRLLETNFLESASTGTQDSLGGEYGFEFVAAFKFVIVSLGRSMAGLPTSTHTITLWQVSTQTALAQVTVGPESAVQDNFAHESVPAPIVINAGHTYRVSFTAVAGTGDGWQDAAGTHQVSSHATVTGGVFSLTGGAYPATATGDMRYTEAVTFYARSLVFWFDAFNYGSALSSQYTRVWKDQSLYGNDLLLDNSGAHARFENDADTGRRSVALDGTTGVGTPQVFGSHGTGITVAVAVRPEPGASGTMYVLDGRDTATDFFVEITSGAGGCWTFTGAGECVVPSEDGWLVAIVLISGDVPTSPTAVQLLSTTALSSAFNGNVGELLIFSTLLDNAERRHVTKRLRTKWITEARSAEASSYSGTVRAVQSITRVLGSDSSTLRDATQGAFYEVLESNDQFGVAVERIGDLDGDGAADLVVGAPGDDTGGEHTGAVYVLFLTASGTVRAYQKISSIDGDFAGTLTAGDGFGSSLAWLGDLNHDGVADVAVGAPGDNSAAGDDSGALWIASVLPSGHVQSQGKWSADNAPLDSFLEGGDYFGWSMAVVGDVDSDGVADLAVGALGDDDGTDTADAGAVYLLFLTADLAIGSVAKISNTFGGLPVKLNKFTFFGSSVARLGDLDLDGVPDIVVGASRASARRKVTGAVYVLFLNGDGTVRSTQPISEVQGALAATLGTGMSFGSAVAFVGDVNGDGIPDIAVGAQDDDDGGYGRGAVFLLFLTRLGLVSSYHKISSVSSDKLEGVINDNDGFGRSVCLVGDLDGDGVADLAVGAEYDSSSDHFDVGAVHVLFLNGGFHHVGCFGLADDLLTAPTTTTHASVTSVSQCKAHAVVDGNLLFALAPEGSASAPTAWTCHTFARTAAVKDALNNPDPANYPLVPLPSAFCNTTCAFDGVCGGWAAMSVYEGVDTGISTAIDVLEGSATSDNTITATVAFDSSMELVVPGFEGSQLVVTPPEGSATTTSSRALSTSSFSVDVTLNGPDGDYVLSYDRAQITSTDGSKNRRAEPRTVTLDTRAPTTTLSSSRPVGPHRSVWSLTVAFSEDVTGFDLGELEATKLGSDALLPAMTMTQLSASVYVVEMDFAGAGEGGRYTFTVPDRVAVDALGNYNEASDPFVFDLLGHKCEQLKHAFLAVDCCRWERDGSEGGYFGDWAARFSGVFDDLAFGDVCGPADQADFEAVWLAKACSSDYFASCGADLLKTGAVREISPRTGRFYAALDAGDEFGRSVSRLGDLNGDGVPEVLAGAPGDDDGGTNFGAVYVVFPYANATVMKMEKVSTNFGNLGAVLETNSRFGFAVAGTGDIDGDGVPDAVVGLGSFAGIYVVFFQSNGFVRSQVYHAATRFGMTASDGLGLAIAAVGDVNGDRHVDVALGAPYHGSSSTGAVVIAALNAAGGVVSYHQISSSEGGLGDVLAAGARFGWALDSGADLDLDGVLDLVVCAPGAGATDGAVWFVALHHDQTVKRASVFRASDLGGDSPVRFGETAVLLHDIDGNGVVDVAATSKNRTSLTLLFLNNDASVLGTLSTELAFHNPNFHTDLIATAAQLDDIDGDGVPDVGGGIPDLPALGEPQGAFFVTTSRFRFLSLGCYSGNSVNRRQYDYHEADASWDTTAVQVEDVLDCYNRAIDQAVDRFAISYNEEEEVHECWVFSSTSWLSTYVTGPGVSSDPIGQVEIQSCDKSCASTLECGGVNYFTSVYAVLASSSITPTLTTSSGFADNETQITVTISMSSDVSGFDIADVYTDGTSQVHSMVEVTARLFVFEATVSGDGDHKIWLEAGAATSPAGLPTSAAHLVYALDTAEPTATLTMNVGENATLSNQAAIQLTITFDETVIRFDESLLSIYAGSGGSTASIGVSAVTYVDQAECYVRDPVTVAGHWVTEQCASQFLIDITLPAGVSSVYLFHVPEGVVWDTVGNANAASESLFYVYDALAPTINSVQVDSGNANSDVISGPDNEIVITITTDDNLRSLQATRFQVGDVVRTPVITRLAADASSRVSNVSLTRYIESHSESVWRITYVTQSDDSGRLGFDIDFSDRAGNAGTTVSETDAVVDFQLDVVTTAPTILAARLFSGNPDTPTLSGPGDTIVLTITTGTATTEQIYALDSFAWIVGGVQRTTVVSPSVGPASEWNVTYEVQPSDNGEVEFSIVYFDIVGNQGQSSKSEFTNDTLSIVSRQARGLEFSDSNPSPGLITGDLVFAGAVSETSITGYSVYLGLSATQRTGNELAYIAKTVSSAYVASLTNVELGSATHLLVYSVTGHNGLSPNPAAKALKGGLAGPFSPPSNAQFSDTSQDEDVFSGTVTWSAASPDNDVAWYLVYLSTSSSTVSLVGTQNPFVANVTKGSTLEAELYDVVTIARYVLVFSVDVNNNVNPTPAFAELVDLVGPAGTIDRVSFRDRSTNLGFISGWVEWDAPATSDGIVAYNVYIGDSPTTKLTSLVGSVIHDDETAIYRLFITVERHAYARYVLVYASSVSTENRVPGYTKIILNTNVLIPPGGSIQIQGSKISIGQLRANV